MTNNKRSRSDLCPVQDYRCPSHLSRGGKPTRWGEGGLGAALPHNLKYVRPYHLGNRAEAKFQSSRRRSPEMAACMAQSLRSYGGSVAANSNALLRQHRALPAPSTWLPCPSLISGFSAGKCQPCQHCQAAPQSSSAAGHPAAELPAVSTASGNTPEENANQLGWLWDRSADATRKKLQADKIRPKKCAPPASSLCPAVPAPPH